MLLLCYLIIGIVAVTIMVLDAAEIEWDCIKEYYKTEPRAWWETFWGIIIWPLTLLAYIQYKSEENEKSKGEGS
jgi:hypothetical protein